MAEQNAKGNEGAKAPSNAQQKDDAASRIEALEAQLALLMQERNAPAPVEDSSGRRVGITDEELASQAFVNDELVAKYDLEKAEKAVDATPEGEEALSFNVRGGQGDSQAYVIVTYSNGTKRAKAL